MILIGENSQRGHLVLGNQIKWKKRMLHKSTMRVVNNKKMPMLMLSVNKALESDMNTTRLLAFIDLHLVTVHRLINSPVFVLFWFPCVGGISWREAASDYRSSTKLREGNVFSRICLSVHTGTQCDHYPWCIGCQRT